MDWLRTVPAFVSGTAAITTLILGYGLTSRRRHQRHLDRLLATLDKLPDDPRFSAARAKLTTEAANVAARVAASMHIGVPVRDYAWCFGTLAVMGLAAWSNTQLDPTLSPGFFQRFNQIINWFIVGALLLLVVSRLRNVNDRRIAVTRMYRRSGLGRR